MASLVLGLRVDNAARTETTINALLALPGLVKCFAVHGEVQAIVALNGPKPALPEGTHLAFEVPIQHSVGCCETPNSAEEFFVIEHEPEAVNAIADAVNALHANGCFGSTQSLSRVKQPVFGAPSPLEESLKNIKGIYSWRRFPVVMNLPDLGCGA